MKKILLLLFLIPVSIFAQREASVHGTFVYVVSDQDNVTLREAKRNCIEKAMVEAVKNEFGEVVISDVIDISHDADGKSSGSYFWENTAAMAKGEWLGQTQEPKIDVKYENGNLVFMAEVWGKAREIVQSKVDLDVSIQKDINGKKGIASSFESGERLYLNFRAPAQGYLAVYLTEGNGRTSCLLPYPKDGDGRFYIKADTDYYLFDKEKDPSAQYYRLTTKHPLEVNQLIIIYSPNPFTKCIDRSDGNKRPNSLKTSDFQDWLLRCQHGDREMVVNKRWLKIHNANIKE